MKALLLLVLLAAFQDPDFDALVRKLGAEDLQERNDAAAKLVALGAKAIPALKRAIEAGDPEVRARAAQIVAEFDRLEGERQADAKNRAKFLPPVPDGENIGLDWVRIEGLKAAFKLIPVPGGRVLQTTPSHPEHVTPVYDITVEDGKGAPVAVERCAICSPRIVLVKGEGPVRARLQGIRRWYSPYEFKFEAPRMGDRQRIGDFAIVVQWPTLLVQAPRPMPTEVLSHLVTFKFELKPGVEVDLMRSETIEIEMPAGPKPASWCACADGPRRAGVIMPQLLEQWTQDCEPIAECAVDRIARLHVRFLKPIEEPIDVRGPLLK